MAVTGGTGLNADRLKDYVTTSDKTVKVKDTSTDLLQLVTMLKMSIK
ncbi:hypothetical protein KHA80_11720 [Anaerobacillus sp. HL2]|nr:hypothetical protein KHA80_11720 [Anaerobacillus sp. HL2]